MHSISVSMLKIETTLFSFQPDSSKWWCKGAILNSLFPPVFLKYSTCSTTDSVSTTGIAAISNNSNGIFKYSAIAAITPPNSNDPVSPIKTFATFKYKLSSLVYNRVYKPKRK